MRACVRACVFICTYVCMCTHTWHDEKPSGIFWVYAACYDDFLLKVFYLLIDDNLVKMYGLQQKKKSL